MDSVRTSRGAQFRGNRTAHDHLDRVDGFDNFPCSRVGSKCPNFRFRGRRTASSLV